MTVRTAWRKFPCGSQKCCRCRLERERPWGQSRQERVLKLVQGHSALECENKQRTIAPKLTQKGQAFCLSLFFANQGTAWRGLGLASDCLLDRRWAGPCSV